MLWNRVVESSMTCMALGDIRCLFFEAQPSMEQRCSQQNIFRATSYHWSRACKLCLSKIIHCFLSNCIQIDHVIDICSLFFKSIHPNGWDRADLQPFCGMSPWLYEHPLGLVCHRSSIRLKNLADREIHPSSARSKGGTDYHHIRYQSPCWYIYSYPRGGCMCWPCFRNSNAIPPGAKPGFLLVRWLWWRPRL